MFCFLSPEQVKIQPVARYDWEQKYYYGNLIAVSNSYLAYAIRGEIPSCLGCDLYSFALCISKRGKGLHQKKVTGNN